MTSSVFFNVQPFVNVGSSATDESVTRVTEFSLVSSVWLEVGSSLSFTETSSAPDFLRLGSPFSVLVSSWCRDDGVAFSGFAVSFRFASLDFVLDSSVATTSTARSRMFATSLSRSSKSLCKKSSCGKSDSPSDVNPKLRPPYSESNLWIVEIC